MDTEYDFTQTVNPTQLIDEINTAGLPSTDYILTSGNCVQIFYTIALTSDQLSTLTTVVTNHVANVNYVTIAVQTQVTILSGYLTNSNAFVANAARAAIVANIAPHLPLVTLTTINSQIKTQVGF